MSHLTAARRYGGFIYCCELGGQEISIDCCTTGGQQQLRRSSNVRRETGGSATLSADVGS